MPLELEGEALLMWHNLVRDLRTLGVLSSTDRVVMVRFCKAWSRWQDAERRSKELGDYETVTTQFGEHTKAAPHVAIALETSKLLDQIGAQLGLSPSARVRLSIKRTKESHDEQDRFFNRQLGAG